MRGYGRSARAKVGLPRPPARPADLFGCPQALKATEKSAALSRDSRSERPLLQLHRRARAAFHMCSELVSRFMGRACPARSHVAFHAWLVRASSTHSHRLALSFHPPASGRTLPNVRRRLPRGHFCMPRALPWRNLGLSSTSYSIFAVRSSLPVRSRSLATPRGACAPATLLVCARGMAPCCVCVCAAVCGVCGRLSLLAELLEARHGRLSVGGVAPPDSGAVQRVARVHMCAVSSSCRVNMCSVERAHYLRRIQAYILA